MLPPTKPEYNFFVMLSYITVYVSIRFQLVRGIRFGGNTPCHEVSPHILFSASAVAGGLTRLSFFTFLERNISHVKTHPLGTIFGMTGSLAVLPF